MQKAIINLVNMIRTVFNYCTDNPTPTAAIAAFGTAKTDVGNKLVLIDSLTQIIDGTSKGVTLDTKIIRNTMSLLALKCGGAITAYAASVNNNTLRLLVDFTIPKLNRFRKEEIDDICQQIRDAANTNIAAAGAFGYAAGDVTDLQTAIDLYRISVQNPRQAIITKKQAVVNVHLLTRQIVDNLFKLQMDKMVSTLLTTEANYIRGYFFAREIINLGVIHTKLSLFVKDQGGSPIQGAMVSLLQDNLVVYSALSGTNGKIALSKISPGTYNLKTEKANYLPIFETGIQFKAGKTVQRSVTLVPGITVIREGDVPPLDIANINVDGIKGISFTSLLIEITGSPLKFYAAVNTTDGPGTEFYQAAVGNAPFVPDEFAIATGFGPDKPFLNVQNTGAVAAHYKLTFSNFAP